MYPSVQATIWGNVGKVTELLDTVLDCFIKVFSLVSCCLCLPLSFQFYECGIVKVYVLDRLQWFAKRMITSPDQS